MRKIDLLAIEATDGFEINCPSLCLWQSKLALRSGPISAAERVADTSFNRWGLEALVFKAQKAFEESTGVLLPWNLSSAGPWWHLPQGNFSSSTLEEWRKKYVKSEKQGYEYVDAHVTDFLKVTDGEPVAYAARFSGWLREAANCPVLVRLFAKTMSERGMGSPRTRVNLWDLFRRFNNPYDAQRRLCAIQDRAQEILEPYGFKASWEALAVHLSGQGKKTSLATGKAARAVAEETVKEFFGRNFGCELDLVQARGLKWFMQESKAFQHWAFETVKSGEFDSLRLALSHAERRLVDDTTDGVELKLDWLKGQSVHGVEVTPGYTQEGDLTFLCVQKGTGRTFHVSRGSWNWGPQTPREVAKEAIIAWRKRKGLQEKEAELFSFLNGDMGFSPLIRIEDSFNSGNCQAGTLSYMREHGWQGRRWIPAVWLAPFLDYALVRNVVAKVYQDFCCLESVG
jgi:hypothetical protein